MVQSVGHSDYGMSLTDQVNTPPAAVEAEKALLGGLMLDDHAWDAGHLRQASGRSRFLSADHAS